MTSRVLIVAALLATAACAPQVPDSGQGVGFSDYSQYELERAQREAQLASGLPAAPGVGTTALAPAPVQTGAIGQTELAQAGIGGSVPYPATTAPLDATGLDATPTNAPPPLVNSTGISDEQDFQAVSERETIESDAERRAQQAAQYQVVTPGAVPTRDGHEGPNIVEYALNAPNVKGQEWYSRFRFSGQGRFQRNCARFVSPDDAQREFLSRGGPDRDPLGIDPDGDGFACGWDPAPFLLARAAAQGN